MIRDFLGRKTKDLTQRSQRAQRKNREPECFCEMSGRGRSVSRGYVSLYDDVVKPQEQRCSHTNSC